MEIKTRAQAAAAGESKYFTGKPCKYDHVTYRYTTSGACASCVRVAAGADRAAMNLTDTRAAKNEAKADLGIFGIRCYPEDLETVRGTALALAQARYPGLTLADIIANPNPTNPAGGTAFYKLRIHGADVDLVRNVAQALLNARGANIEAARRRILADIQAAADAEVKPLPEWKP